MKITLSTYEMASLKLPEDSIDFLLFQRTGYLKSNFIFKVLTKIGEKTPFYKQSVRLKSALFAKQIKEEFTFDITEEFETIKAYLPEGAKSILDIGCGIAGIDIFISDYYKNAIDIFLIDKSIIDEKVHYQFEKTGSFYNSLEVSRHTLEMNGVAPNRIHLQEATPTNEITFKQNLDIIISIISWGFHYPVATYLDAAYNKLNKNGIMIIDVRKGTNGEKEIEKKFGNCKVIYEGPKLLRVLAKKV